MKYFILLGLGLSFLNLKAQDNNQPAFDGHKWEAPYNLPIPRTYTIERFLIPISFAPSINYKGVEDIRFTPGWGNIKTHEYWTYAFLWWLDGTVEMDSTTIANNLKAYYTGLAKANNVPVDKQIPVKTSLKESTPGKEDLKKFTGTIEIVDYMTKEPLTLFAIVHIRRCNEENKTVVFHKISPKPFTHSNWATLDELWQQFSCKK